MGIVNWTSKYLSFLTTYAMISAMKPNILSVMMWQLGGGLKVSQILNSLVKHKITEPALAERRRPVIILDKKKI